MSDIQKLALFLQKVIFVHHQGKKNCKQKIQMQADKYISLLSGRFIYLLYSN